ncbi:MAG: hypothetical protein HQK51_07850 [Oligoflexia bacterium]|nr:hypothetical protein [Oligoflexia bacterium]
MSKESKSNSNGSYSLFQRWRTRMAVTYIAICLFDFIIAPIFWALIMSLNHQAIVQWQPLTLAGAGLFHISMGAILGVSAFSKSRERITELANTTLKEGA